MVAGTISVRQKCSCTAQERSHHHAAVLVLLLYRPVGPAFPVLRAGVQPRAGSPIVFFGIMDRDLSAEFVEANPQVYATGQTNSLSACTPKEDTNAIGYALILSLIYFYAVADSFNDQALYIMGTTVYTGLLAMQMKAFPTPPVWPQITVMVLSWWLSRSATS